MFNACLLKHLHKCTHACFVLLIGNISVSITSIHAQYQKYILCISDSIIYPGMHRSLAYRSHSPEQAQRAVHFKPAFTHLQHPTQPFVQPQ